MTASTWIVGTVIAVALVVLFSVLDMRESEKERAAWQAFVDENDCHIVEVKDPQTGSSMGPGIGFDGKMTLVHQTVRLPGQECWLCSNGTRYWKKAGLAIDRSRNQ